MSDVAIRARVQSDIPNLAAVLVQVYDRDRYPVEGVKSPMDWLNVDGCIGAWTALLDGQPVGHVALTRPNGDDDAVTLLMRQEPVVLDQLAVLGRLFVSPEARGRKLGLRLTETAMQAASTLGLRLVLDVMSKDVGAISIYEQLGWKKLGTIQHCYGDGLQEDGFSYASPSRSHSGVNQKKGLGHQ